LREDKPDGLGKEMLLQEGLIELRRMREQRASKRDRRPQPGPAFEAYMDRLLDGERDISLLFAVEDVGRDLRVPFATALDWVIEYIDRKLLPA
jgi:hypothetical protein